MELDELKKSWNTLNEQLQKESITNDEQVIELITRYKDNANKSLKCLTGWQRFSITIGIVGILVLSLIWILPSLFHISEECQSKINVLTIFIGISILGGIWWDCKNYIWIKNTKIDEMPVSVVSKRMLQFRQWIKAEIITISAWIIVFNVVYYWAMNFNKASIAVQAILIGIIVLGDVVIIYFLYKKIAYKHLDNIKKNIDELKDICSE
ncbi:MAG: hypothetical protein LKI39_06535 [Bacteroides sp.]|jgi:hypothetical protein|nr:hypothetical protein [Bacteroides sp.]